MKLKLILTTAIVGWSWPCPAFRAPRHRRADLPGFGFSDGSGPAIFPSTIVNGFVTIEELNATSGPSGENPTGELMFDVPGQFFRQRADHLSCR